MQLILTDQQRYRTGPGPETRWSRLQLQKATGGKYLPNGSCCYSQNLLQGLSTDLPDHTIYDVVVEIDRLIDNDDEWQ